MKFAILPGCAFEWSCSPCPFLGLTVNFAILARLTMPVIGRINQITFKCQIDFSRAPL